MKLKNVSTSTISFGDLSLNGVPVSLAPLAEVIVYDEDAEKSTGLASLMNAGIITQTGNDEPDEAIYAAGVDSVDHLITWVRSGDTEIKFNATTYSGPANTPITVTVKTINAAGQKDLFDYVSTIVVTADAGTIYRSKWTRWIHFAER